MLVGARTRTSPAANAREDDPECELRNSGLGWVDDVTPNLLTLLASFLLFLFSTFSLSLYLSLSLSQVCAYVLSTICYDEVRNTVSFALLHPERFMHGAQEAQIMPGSARR